MASPSAADVIQAFATVLRDQLEDGEDVHVPGLGTFEVVHHPSETVEDDDGTKRLAPPRDAVSFTPES